MNHEHSMTCLFPLPNNADTKGRRLAEGMERWWLWPPERLPLARPTHAFVALREEPHPAASCPAAVPRHDRAMEQAVASQGNLANHIASLPLPSPTCSAL